MNIYKTHRNILTLTDRLINLTKMNGLNELESKIVMSLVHEESDESIYKALQKLGESIHQGDNITVTNEQIPSHYTSNKIEPIKFIEENNLDYNEGNIIKYITRYKSKNGIKDLNKIYFYFLQMKYGNYDKVKEL